jgi:hypothetical protein
MPRTTGTVTEVGAGNIQFYIPTAVSSHGECLFDPGDEFEVCTLSGVGLLLVDPDSCPDPPDVAAAYAELLDDYDSE